MIELVNVSRIYRRGADEVHALERVTLRVERGRFAALMGPSGSGKSTLLHLIAGLDQPTGGTVSVAGHRLADLGEDAREALRSDADGAFVFVVSDGRLRRQRVETGGRSGGRVVVGSGLAGGESLVVGNVGELREGDAVEPVEAP